MKIAVLASGGVDSSVALKLLKDQGHDVTAFYLKIWLENDISFLGGECPWEEDLKYVREICERENVPLEIINMQKEYFDTVVKYTLDEVKNGRTPNPDIMCNSNIKFGFFLDKIGKEYEKVASGHYAKLVEINDRFFLKMTPDKIKDQTYFLANLRQDQLKRIVFPIAEITKEEVRGLAEKFDLPNKDRKDSQGICFLGKFKYTDFLKHYLGVKKGDILEFETGEKLGEHEGFWNYTVGQRKGIKLGGGPYYVVKKDMDDNIVYVSKQYDSEEKERNSFKVSDFNWFEGEFPKKKELKVKLRHGPKMYNCVLEKAEKDSANVKIDGNDQGIAQGQFAVFYDGKICLGLGKIS